MTREPHPVDIHVGRRIRELRSYAGISQTALAERLGITFQQLQKYEIGANRVSASRLWEMARVLTVPVDSFFPEPDRHSSGPLMDDPGLARWVRLYPTMLAHRRDAVVRIVRAILREEV